MTGAWLLLGVFLLSGCGGERERSFSIPSGFAGDSLKVFARQADVEIIFNTLSVRAIVTKEVEGFMSPNNALEKMLEDTALEFAIDRETGAYAVTVSRLLESRFESVEINAYAGG